MTYANIARREYPVTSESGSPFVTNGYLQRQARSALSMAQAFGRGDHRRRVYWQERCADYRETIIDRMRRAKGWTLAERVAGRKAKA